MTDIELLTCTVGMMRESITAGYGTALIRLTDENKIGLEAPNGAAAGFVFFVPKDHAQKVNAAALNLSKGTVQQPIKDGRQLAPSVEALDKAIATVGVGTSTSIGASVTPTTIQVAMRKMRPYRIGGIVASATALIGPKWLRTPAIIAALLFLGLELRASVRGQTS